MVLLGNGRVDTDATRKEAQKHRKTLGRNQFDRKHCCSILDLADGTKQQYHPQEVGNVSHS
jgi:hypothetical protein